MKIKIDCPPSVNRRTPFSIPHELPTGRVDVKITVCPSRRSGDVDNRIKPVLDVLEARGMKVVAVSCRFGRTNSIEIKNHSERKSAVVCEGATAGRNVVSLAQSGRVGRGRREGG